MILYSSYQFIDNLDGECIYYTNKNEAGFDSYNSNKPFNKNIEINKNKDEKRKSISKSIENNDKLLLNFQNNNTEKSTIPVKSDNASDKPLLKKRLSLSPVSLNNEPNLPLQIRIIKNYKIQVFLTETFMNKNLKS